MRPNDIMKGYWERKKADLELVLWGPEHASVSREIGRR